VTSQTRNWVGLRPGLLADPANLTLNAGLRYEEQRLRYADEIAAASILHHGADQEQERHHPAEPVGAPVGLIYDFTKEGRSKVYSSWSRFYESIRSASTTSRSAAAACT